MLELICYVCSKKVKSSEGVYIGKDTWRHDQCHPGSDKWHKSKVSENSKFKDVLAQKEEVVVQTEEVKTAKLLKIKEKHKEKVKDKISFMFK